MARIISIGAGLQDVYLLDGQDFRASESQGEEIYRGLEVGSKVDIDRMCYRIGGGGVNSAVAFARHGHDVMFLGNVARDPAGDAVVRELAREGVDTSHVNFLEQKNTGSSVILLDTNSGERTILTYRGASEQFGNFSAAEIVHFAPEWLYITTLRGDLKSLKRFGRAAREAGAQVMFNPGVREFEQAAELVKLLEYIDVLIINRAEAKQLVAALGAGKAGDDLTGLLTKLQEYVKTVIVTDGSSGAMATNGTESYRLGLYEDCAIVDATGAGDAFGSGFLAHLAAEKSFGESLVFAAANSTAVVQQIGGHTGTLGGAERLHKMPVAKL